MVVEMVVEIVTESVTALVAGLLVGGRVLDDLAGCGVDGQTARRIAGPERCNDRLGRVPADAGDLDDLVDRR